MAPSLFAMMRLHPKKSIFILTTANTALWFTYDYTVTSDLHRKACKRAASFGDERLRHFDGHPRHVTVILNPVAGKRKSKKLYTRWVEPLLHLAGIKVSLVETESPKQAYDLMKIMSNCDGVAVVGGDGTVHEAIYGLLQRPDSVKAAHDFPIGIMPTGKNNVIARIIYQRLHYRNQKELLVQAALNLINQTSDKSSATATATARELSMYTLRDIQYGKYQGQLFKITAYPFYQSYIEPLWIKLLKMFKKNYTLPQVEAIACTDPCIGCSRCIDGDKFKTEPSKNWRLWSVLAPKSNAEPSDQEKRELELSKRDNPTCDRWTACMVGDKSIRVSIDQSGSEYDPSQAIDIHKIGSKIMYRYTGEASANP